MKKFVITLGIFVFLILRFPFHLAQATLQSNLVDPGMRQRNWGFLHTSPSLYFDATCKESSLANPIWRISGLGFSSIPCDVNGPIYAQWSTTPNGGQAISFTVNNLKNAPSLICSADMNYIGIQPHYFPSFGYKQVLFFNLLNKFVVRATVKNNGTTICNNGNCSPACPDPNRFNTQGNGWSTLIIGIPFYDRTYNWNYFLELVIYGVGNWYNVSNGGQAYFHGRPWNNLEMYRIPLTHPANAQDQTSIPPGAQHTYEIDMLPILKNLSWENPTINWNTMQMGDAYVGVEISGNAQQNFTVSDLDVLYEEKPTDNFQPAGWFDGARPDVLCAVRGWTCDQDKFSEPLEIELYEGATKLSTPLPIIADSGFEAPGLCGNTGNHRFYYTFPAGHPIRNNGTHAITAKAVGIGVATDGSVVKTTSVVLPLSYTATNIITCPVLPTNTPIPPTSTPIPPTNTPTKTPTLTPTPTPIPGDLNNDRKVNVADLRAALSQSPLNIFTYTLVVGNYGRP